MFPLDGGRVDHSLFIIILFCVRLKDGVVDILRTREGMEGGCVWERRR